MLSTMIKGYPPGALRAAVQVAPLLGEAIDGRARRESRRKGEEPLIGEKGER